MKDNFDDIKTALHAMDWPTPSPDLGARILARLENKDLENKDADTLDVPWFLAAPLARLALGAGLTACLVAGLLVGPQLAAGTAAHTVSSYWSGAGVGMAYYLAS